MRECSDAVFSMTVEGVQVPDANRWNFDFPVGAGNVNQTFIVSQIILDYSHGGTGLYRASLPEQNDDLFSSSADDIISDYVLSSSSEDDIISDYFRGGTGLYGASPTEQNYVLFFSSEDDMGEPQQTKPLRDPPFFIPFETVVTLEKYSGQTFQPSVPGNISIIVVSSSCEEASRDCVINVQRVSQAECVGALGIGNYHNIFRDCLVSPICNQGEFTCDSGICIPQKLRCDGLSYDCIDDSDEQDCEVDPGCYNSGGIINCVFESQHFRGIEIYSNRNTSSSIEFVVPGVEGLFVHEVNIELSAYGSSIFRMNITTLSGTEVVYRRRGEVLFFSFGGLLPLRPSEHVSITVEGIGDPLLHTWKRLDVSSVKVSGVAFVELPCEQSRGCLEVLSVDAPSPSCYLHSLYSFLSEKFEHCKAPPTIAFLSPSVHLRMGSGHAVACIAKTDGGPALTVELVVNGRSEYEDMGNFSQVNSATASVEFFGVFGNTTVTCRASVFGLTVERTMNISILDGGCAAKLDGVHNFTNFECLPLLSVIEFRNRIGLDTVLFEAPISDGYLVNGSINLAAPVVDFTLEVRLPFLDSPARRRRGLGNVVYQRAYKDIVISRTTAGDFPIYFNPPIRVPDGYSVQVSIERMSRPRFTETPGLHVSLGFLPPCGGGDQQFCDIEQWRRAVNEECFRGKYIPEIEDSKHLLLAVEICHGITIEEPEIILDPVPLIKANSSSSFTAQCEAENAIDVEWYKREWYGEVSTGLRSNVLSFEQFNSGDQGLYYCVALGGGNFSNANVSSGPVAVVLDGFPTFLATQRFVNLTLTRPLMNPSDMGYMEIAGLIEEYYSILYDYGVERIQVQRLLPGSVVAETQLVVRQDSVEAVRAFVASGNLSDIGESNQEVDFSASKLQSVSFCEASFVNDSLAGQLSFAEATIASVADSMELCPSYSSLAGTPRATRACGGDFIAPSYWEEPVIQNCFEGEDPGQALNDLIEHLEDNPVGPENVTTVSRDLADATESGGLTGEDLEDVVLLLEYIVGVNSSSPEVTSNVIEIVDNILDLQENVYEESLQDEAPIRVLQALEGQLKNLHGGDGDVNFTDVRAFVGAVARTLDQSDFGNPITFGSFFLPDRDNIKENLNESETSIRMGSGGYSLDKVKATITLPMSILDGTRYENSDSIPLTFIIHRTSNLFMTNQAPQTDGLVVESLIIAATIEGVRLDTLQDPIQTRFRLLPLEVVTDESRRGCYFWDFSLLNGTGNWSTEGCQLVSGSETGDTEELIRCDCNHLTNFAILLDVQGDVESLFLDILSIIGCIVSIIAVLIVIITFLGVKKFRSQRPKQILVNLCFSLLGLYLTFLIGIHRSDPPAGCVVFGALIHFFCLASVAWMTVEAVNMYLLFVKVFASGIRWFMVKASIGAWGCPLIVVIVSVIFRSEHYRGDYCFPQSGTFTFYIGVCVLIALMLVGNLVTFILVVRRLSTSKSMASKDQDRRQEALRYIAISVLLGLAWVSGFLAIGLAQFIFNLLFLIFNTLQGFFIFLFFCLRQPDVRAVWWQWLHCRRYEPERVTSTDTGTGHKPKSQDATTTKLTGSTPAANSESVQMVIDPRHGNEGDRV